MNKTNTEYSRCTISDVTPKVGVGVSLDTVIVQKRESFKYLGSITKKNGNIDDDVIHHIGVEWMNLMLTSRDLCDQKVPQKLKGIFYRIVVTPAMLYEVKC